VKKLLRTASAEGLDSRVRKEVGRPAAMRCCWRELRVGADTAGLEGGLRGRLCVGRLEAA